MARKSPRTSRTSKNNQIPPADETPATPEVVAATVLTVTGPTDTQTCVDSTPDTTVMVDDPPANTDAYADLLPDLADSDTLARIDAQIEAETQSETVQAADQQAIVVEDTAPAAPVLTPIPDVYAALVGYVRSLVPTADNGALVAALIAGHLKVRLPRPVTANGNPMVTCTHCAKVFVGRPKQIECRVCSDYEKKHGVKRPLNGTATARPPVVSPAGIPPRTRRGTSDTHRPH